MPIYVDSPTSLDLALGAVEIKDATTTTRLNVVLEDAAHVSGAAGLTLLTVRNDVLASLVDTDGDNAPLQVNDIGALFVSGEHREDDAHVTLDYGHFMLAVRDDAISAKTDADGDYSGISVDDVGYLYSRLRGYDTGSDSNKSFEVAPIWNQHVEETIADVTNETDATTNYFIDMDGYSGLNLQLIISGGSGTMTVTVAASAQDDGTAAASVTYRDVTNDVFGAASFTASTYLFDDAKVLGGAKFVRIQTVSSTGGSNDADITIYAKRVF